MVKAYGVDFVVGIESTKPFVILKGVYISGYVTPLKTPLNAELVKAAIGANWSDNKVE